MRLREHNQKKDGPVIVRLRDGEEFEALYSDGSGMMIIPGGGRYEVSWVIAEFPKYKARSVYQEQIESVRVKETDQEVEFGNQFIEGHPRYEPAFRRIR